jgi:5-methylcytosine-specific restriction endonuclease McrA
VSRSPSGGNAGNGSKWIRRVKRLRIYARDRWRCVWCKRRVRTARTVAQRKGGVRARVACLDHVVPRNEGGTNDPSNLLTACVQCNEARGALSVLQFVTRRSRSWRRHFWHHVVETLERVIHALSAPLPIVRNKETKTC